MSDKKLKDCPMCGSVDVYPWAEKMPYRVRCGNCDCASGFANTKELAIKLWNIRPQEDKLTAIVKELREALKVCMIGGNHLAHILIKNLGVDFCDRYPFNANHEEVLERLGMGDNYDVWCCWSQIMKARDKQEQALLGAE